MDTLETAGRGLDIWLHEVSDEKQGAVRNLRWRLRRFLGRPIPPNAVYILPDMSNKPDSSLYHNALINARGVIDQLEKEYGTRLGRQVRSRLEGLVIWCFSADAERDALCMNGDRKLLVPKCLIGWENSRRETIAREIGAYRFRYELSDKWRQHLERSYADEFGTCDESNFYRDVDVFFGKHYAEALLRAAERYDTATEQLQRFFRGQAESMLKRYPDD